MSDTNAANEVLTCGQISLGIPSRESLLFAPSRLIDDTKTPIADVLFLLTMLVGAQNGAGRWRDCCRVRLPRGVEKETMQ